MADFASSLVVDQAVLGVEELFEMVGARWMTWNDFQELVVRHSAEARVIAKLLEKGQLISKAAHDADTVNRFLRVNEFDLQLRDVGSGPLFAYAASIIKLMGGWPAVGETGYKLPDIRKPGFRLDSAVVSHFSVAGQHMVRIETDGGFDFWAAKRIDSSGFQMIDEWIRRISFAERVSGNGAVLPLVAIGEATVDISDLVGLSYGATNITEAISAAKFSLTQKHVKFEMAAAVSAKRAMETGVIQKGDFVVDGPLHFALVKRQMPLMPLAVGTVLPFEFSDNKELY